MAHALDMSRVENRASKSLPRGKRRLPYSLGNESSFSAGYSTERHYRSTLVVFFFWTDRSGRKYFARPGSSRDFTEVYVTTKTSTLSAFLPTYTLLGD